MKKQILAGVLAASMIFGTTAFAAFSDLSGFQLGLGKNSSGRNE